MAAVKARADQQPLAERAETQTHIGMLQALQQLGDDRDRDELPRLHTDQPREQRKGRGHEHIVQQVVAVIAPHRHLALAVVQAVQRPPKVELVLPAVEPVAHEVEHDEVGDETDRRNVRHARPQRIELPGGQAGQPQLAGNRVPGRLDAEEHRQAHQPQAVDQRVDHVGAHRRAVADGLDRPAALQQPDAEQQHRHLDAAPQQPASGIEGVLQQIAKAECEHEGLHDGLVQRELRGIKGVGDPVDHGLRASGVLDGGGENSAAKRGCSRNGAKHRPRCSRPVISGSSTAGAQGSWRCQMPRWAIRMSPGLMSRSAFSSSCAFG
mmetsp:Transcript_36595/g.84867  ORF Transcript_36595/g.84867 Transcript_36595/m.84867 type:complete len:323 (-) Transcript_36595:1691-2659(-)